MISRDSYIVRRTSTPVDIRWDELLVKYVVDITLGV